MKSSNKLGNYIERIIRRNSDQKYGLDDVRGCSNTKSMMKTKANMLGRTFEKFFQAKNVPPSRIEAPTNRTRNATPSPRSLRTASRIIDDERFDLFVSLIEYTPLCMTIFSAVILLS